MMLRLPSTLREEMVAHCRREYPKEACGILAGTGGRVTQVYPMTNVDQSPISYQMDPKEQLLLMKQMRGRAQEWLAIYHSHTASAAIPSPTDVQLAISADISYVLVSLKPQAKPDVQCYRIADGQVSPELLGE